MEPFEELRNQIISCRRCPRLVAFREQVPAKGAFAQQAHWRKPLPGLGEADAWLMIVGLAPSIHGGNRTGRVFTGDASGVFLIKALHAEGFASQPTSEHIDDGLKLKECYLTASVKCVPPQNRPTAEEFHNCRPFLDAEWGLLSNVQAILALGKSAFEVFGGKSFKHGACLEGRIPVYASYHPSPQNTYTGKLTQEMFCALLRRIRSEKR